MRQVLLNLRDGSTQVVDVPAPAVRPNHVLIQTRASLISAGTERMAVEFGKASLLAKARSQPERVKQVLDKIRADGLLPTLEVVFAKLDEPMPIGYCNAGVVLGVGPGVTEFKPGDRVASNGAHAEIVCVPGNLCAKIPDDVPDEQAAFAVVSSIGLEGVRLLNPTLGEKFVVYGLGLIGLISVQLLRAHGCEVMGLDINPDRLKMAERYGAKTVLAGEGTDPVVAAEAWTRSRGVDGVLITAAAETDEIVHQSAGMCRKRGRIVLVGVVGLNLRRSDFYEKELSFQVSCSYGPGRYDDGYEGGGQDYPYGFVRWTEQRNFEAVLEAMRAGRLTVEEMISHRFGLEQAMAAYRTLTEDRTALAVILGYPGQVSRESTVAVGEAQPAAPKGRAPVVAVIGAGGFTRGAIVPAFGKIKPQVAYVADVRTIAAQDVARRVGAARAATDYRHALEDPNVNTVIIAVPHNLHAALVCESLEAGKHTLVEKPLAMNVEELARVVGAAGKACGQYLMVGFNRRFSRHTVRAKQLLAGRAEPLCMNMTVNAGFVPPEHWAQDPVRGGGRIVGEACHFIDLMVHLAGSRVKSVAAAMVGGDLAIRTDKMSIVLALEDGSVGTVNYFANGSKRYPKETLEVFSDRRVLRLENFRRLVGYGFAGFRRMRTWRQDKGHTAEFAAFLDLVGAGGDPLIPLDELVNVTLASFAAMTAAAENRTIDIAQEYASALEGIHGEA